MKTWLLVILSIVGFIPKVFAETQLVQAFRPGSPQAALSQNFYIYGGNCHSFRVLACNLSISREALAPTEGSNTTASINVWVFLDWQNPELNRVVKYLATNSKLYKPVPLYLETLKEKSWQQLDGVVIGVPEQEIQKPEYEGLDASNLIKSKGDFSFSRFDK